MVLFAWGEVARVTMNTLVTPSLSKIYYTSIGCITHLETALDTIPPLLS